MRMLHALPGLVATKRALARLCLVGLLVPAVAWSADPAEPQPKNFNGVPVLSGGVSDDEAAAFKRLAPQYSLRVILSGRAGAYNVAQRMVVAREGAVLVDLSDAGPWLLIGLPPGHYTLDGTFEGVTSRRQVAVTAAGVTLNWVTPAAGP